MNYSKVSEIFDVSYGSKLDMNKMTSCETSSIAFVSRSSKNNGVVGFVDEIGSITPLEKGLITVTLGGTYVLSSFLQTRPFYTAQNVAVLKPKLDLTDEEKLYYCLCIKQNRFRYSAFGREANRSLKNILLPSVEDIPTWVNEVNISKFENADNKLMQCYLTELDVNNWKTFRLDELFELKKGKRLTKLNIKPGLTPFIAAIDKNNGCRQLISHQPIHSGNTITVNYNGSVAEAFYQEKPFYASDDVNVLYPKFKMTVYSALFLISIIKKEKFRFNYGRKWHLERMESTLIKLPTENNGQPDFKFMEDYIKSVRYSAVI